MKANVNASVNDIRKKVKQVAVLQELIGKLGVEENGSHSVKGIVDALRSSLRRVYSSAYMPLAEKCACLSLTASWPMTTTPSYSSYFADLAKECEEEVAALVCALWNSESESFQAGSERVSS